MSDQPFRPIAEREFQLRGPAERVVRVSIGTPEPDPGSGSDFRCPFQVTGLSDDTIQYAHGVDSFQALNLAFAGVRNRVKTNASVLASFHDDFSLTWEGSPWEESLPIWATVHGLDQARRLERFLEDLWTKTPRADD